MFALFRQVHDYDGERTELVCVSRHKHKLEDIINGVRRKYKLYFESNKKLGAYNIPENPNIYNIDSIKEII